MSIGQARSATFPRQKHKHATVPHEKTHSLQEVLDKEHNSINQVPLNTGTIPNAKPELST